MRTLNEVQPYKPITSVPFTITNAGAYYLVSNLQGAAGMGGIVINADNVTVDLNGFALTGFASNSGTGIMVAGGPRHNIQIRNGFVQKWAGGGILAGFSVESTIERVTVFQNMGTGMGIGENSRITDCGAHLNTMDGVVASDGVSVTGCKSTDNGGNGFVVQSTVRIEDCTAARNGANGFSMRDHGDIRQCMSMLNTSNGVVVKMYCRVIEVSSGQNGRSGIRLEGAGCRIENNHFPRNAYGIEVSSGWGGNLFFGNTTVASLTNNYLWGGNGDYYGRIATTNDMQGSGFDSTNPWANFAY